MEALITEMAQVYEDLKAGKITQKQATCNANIAGKIISANRAQVIYYAVRGERPKLPFLDANNGIEK